jgi:ubiquinone/menaquinone biosynthesis C-methylase UbiE
MGFFTLDVARMVGARGRVVAVDLQENMLKVLRRRLLKAGLADRADIRRAETDHLGIDDLAGSVDLVVAIFVVHEMPGAGAFFATMQRALRPGGRLLFAEPKGHVRKETFDQSLVAASRAGFANLGEFPFPGAHAVLLAPT